MHLPVYVILYIRCTTDTDPSIQFPLRPNIPRSPSFEAVGHIVADLVDPNTTSYVVRYVCSLYSVGI